MLSNRSGDVGLSYLSIRKMGSMVISLIDKDPYLCWLENFDVYKGLFTDADEHYW